MVFWCGGAPEAVQREKVGKIGKGLFLIGFQRDIREFLVRFRGMVFWCGGGLFSVPDAIQREKVGKISKRLFLIEFRKGR